MVGVEGVFRRLGVEGERRAYEEEPGFRPGPRVQAWRGCFAFQKRLRLS